MSSTRSFPSTQNQSASLTPSAHATRGSACGRQWRKPSFISTLAATLALLAVSVVPVLATVSDNWTGATSGNFGDGTNWDHGVPGAGIATVIDLNTGNASVITADSYFTGSLVVGVGNDSVANQITIQDGGSLVSDGAVQLGQLHFSSGRMVVTSLSTWETDSSLSVGTNGTGYLTVSNGGLVTAAGFDGNGFALSVGTNTNGDGNVTVTGVESVTHTPSTISANGGSIVVGDQGTGTLAITSGGVVTVSATDNNGYGFIAGNAGGSVGNVSVSGIQNATLRSTLESTNGPVVIGLDGSGNVTVAAGGKVNAAGSDGSGVSSYFGYGVGSTGTAQVTSGSVGVQSLWDSGRGIVVGLSGNADVTASSGGKILAASSSADANGNGLVIGSAEGSNGNLTVTGYEPLAYVSTVEVAHGALVVGLNGNGNLSIANGAYVTANGTDSGNVAMYVGSGANATGNVTINGDGTDLDVNNGALVVGDAGYGVLSIQNNAEVSVSGNNGGNISVIIGNQAGSNGRILVDDAHGTFETSGGAIIIGNEGSGNLTVDAAASAQTQISDGSNVTVYIAYGANGTGSALVTDNGSAWYTDGGALVVGHAGNGSLTVQNGGYVRTDSLIVANQADSIGTVTVTGTNSIINSTAGQLIVGNDGNGSLTIENGGNATFAGDNIEGISAIIGQGASSVGNVSVTGENSTLNLTGELLIGNYGIGNLSVADCGVVQGSTVMLGFTDGSSGSLFIDGANTNVYIGSLYVAGDSNTTGNVSITNGGYLEASNISIGSFGNGTVTVTDNGSFANMTGPGSYVGDGEGSSGTLTVSNGGAFFSNGTLVVGYNEGSTGNVTVTDAGSNLTVAGSFNVGDTGTGSLSILNGGAVHADDMTLGVSGGGNGSVTVSDANSTLAITDGSLYVGDFGNGTLTVQNGGNVSVDNTLYIGYDVGTGNVTVTGANSTLSASDIYVGDDSIADLTISNGGVVTSSGSLYIADDSIGTVTVTGANSTLNVDSTLYVGYSDFFLATLAVDNGGQVNANSVTVGSGEETNGTLTVADAGSTLNVDNNLVVGDEGSGNLTVSNGGNVTTGYLGIGYNNGGNGTVTVTDANSTLYAGSIDVSDDGNGTLNVQNGGLISVSGNVYVGDGGNGTLTVTDVNSTLSVSNTLHVGYSNDFSGNGNLTVTNGGTVTAGALIVGTYEDTNGTVTVAETNSTLHVTDSAVIVGNESNGAVYLYNGGALTIDSTNGYNNVLVLGNQTDSSGTLNVGRLSSFGTGVGNVVVGLHGFGNLTYENGGTGTFTDNVTIFAGKRSGSEGDINVNGEGSQLTLNGSNLVLGQKGSGYLGISNGGVVDATLIASSIMLGVNSTGSGEIDLYDGGTLALGAFDGYAINTGDGSGNIYFSGGTLQATGNTSINTSGVFVDESNSTITVSDNATLIFTGNSSGNGSLHVDGNGTLTFASFTGNLGNLTVGNATVVVDGADDFTLLHPNGTVVLGNAEGDIAALLVTNGSQMSIANDAGESASLVVGGNANTTGSVTIDGESSLYVYGNSTIVGNEGAGSLTVTNSGYVQLNSTNEESNGLVISGTETGSGAVIVSNSGNLNIYGGLVVGSGNTGSLTVANGGLVEINSDEIADVGLRVNNNSTIIISDESNSGTNVTVDNGGVEIGNGSLSVSGGNFTVSGGSLAFGAENNTASATQTGGNVTVSDNSSYFVLGFGVNSTTTYDISGGNLVVNGGFIIANNVTSNATFSQSGGTVTTAGDARVGYQGDGTLNISGGTFDTGTNHLVLSSEIGGGNGTLNLTGGVLATGGIHRDTSEGVVLLNLNGGTLRANVDSNNFFTNFADDEITIGENGVTFDSNCFNIAVYSNLTGNGGLTKIGHGNLTLYGFTSVTDTTVNGGKLIINDSQMDVSGDLNVASQWCVTASLKIICSAFVDTTNLVVAGGRYSTGTVTVSNSELDAVYASIGQKGQGTLNITNGGSVYIESNEPTLNSVDPTQVSMVIGALSCGNGTVLIDGEESGLYIYQGSLLVADCGTGTLTVQNGGYLNTAGSDSSGTAAYVGGRLGHSGSGYVTITDSGSKWLVSGGKLVIDDGGEGYVTVSNGGNLTISGSDGSLTALVIGQSEATSSNLTVTGANSTVLVNGGTSIVGNGGDASISVVNGGTLTFSGTNAYSVALFLGSGSSSSAYVGDVGSALDVNNGSAVVGFYGNGNLEIANGASVNFNGQDLANIGVQVGYASDVTGNIYVHDVELCSNTSSLLTVSNGFAIFGVSGTGILDIENGGAVNFNGSDENSVSAYFGKNSGSTGNLVVYGIEPTTGYQSNLYTASALVLGDRGYADVRVTNGAYIEVGGTDENGIGLYAGNHSSGNSSIVISGVNIGGVNGNVSSALYVANGAAILGNHGDAFVSVSNGGLFQIAGADESGVGLYLGYNSCSYGNLEITGVEACTNITSTLDLQNGYLVIGYNGQGALTLSNGGLLSIGTSDANGVAAYIGYNEGSVGYLTVTGVVSSSNTSTTRNFVAGSLIVGNSGTGTLIVSNGGNVGISASDINGSGLYAGFSAGGSGSISVSDIESSSGIRSTLTVVSAPAILGYDGSGSTSINNGGLVNFFGVDGTHVGAYLGLDEGAYGGISVYDVNRDGDPVSSTLIVNRALVVGFSGNGDVSVGNGGYVSVAGVGADDSGVGLYIAQGINSTASVNVSDIERHLNTRSTLDVANGSVIVANQGNAGLYVSNGGLVQILGHDDAGIGLMIGLDANGTGTLSVADVANICSTYTAATLTFNGSALVVGGSGYGCVTITNGGYVTGGTDGLGVIIGNSEGADGHLQVSDVEFNSGYRSTLLVNAGALVVGNEGNGTMYVQNGGLVTVSGNTSGNVGLIVGSGANSTAYVYVQGVETSSGNYSKLDVAHVALVGFDGNGTLTVSNGGFFDVNGYNCGGVGLGIGYDETGTGTVTVTGIEFCSSRASEMDVYNGALVVGYSGNGTLNVQDGGTVYLYPDAVDTNGYSLAVGYNEGSTGSVSIDGHVDDASSRLEVDSGLAAAGIDGTGYISVTNGGKLVLFNANDSGVALDLGVNEGSYGSLTVDGEGSAVSANAGWLIVGDSGSGELTITNSGSVEFDGTSENNVGLVVGASEGSNGTVTVADGGNLTINGAAVFGDYGNATVSITNGGNITINGQDEDHGFAAYIGWHGTSNSSVTVDGNGSSLNLNGTLVVGNWGNGTLNITNTGSVQINNSDENGVGLYVGRGRNGHGDVLVSDNGFELVQIDEELVPVPIHSSLSVESGAVVVGNDGHGNLTIANGAEAFLDGRDSNEVALYVGLNGHGNVTVTDANSTLNVSGGALVVDQGGHGYLTIANGGTVNVDYAVCTTGLSMVIGYGVLDHGVVTVDGEGSTLNITNGSLAVGFSGRANLTASNGGTITLSGADSSNITMTIGTYNSCNQVLITDLDSSLSITNGALLIGLNATGNLTVANGGYVSVNGTNGNGQSVILGVNSEGTGELYIDGSLNDEPVIRPLGFVTSQMEVSNGAVYAGLSGTGNISIVNGGALTINGTDNNGVSLDLGRNEDSTGNVLVQGSNLTVDNGAVRVGDYGSGYLTGHASSISLNGYDDRGVGLYVGRHESGYGYVYLDNGSELNVTNGMVRVGDYGTGTIFIGSGASMNITSENMDGIALDIGRHESGNGTVIVQDEGSALNIGDEDGEGALIVGNAGAGNLTVANGGTVNINGYDGDETSLFIGLNEGSNGTVTVTDAGSSLNINDEQYATVVGQSGNGTLTVANGGSFYANGWDDNGVAIYIGNAATGNGTLTVTDAGSTLSTDEGTFVVGNQGNGTLNIFNGAAVTVVPADGNETGALIIAQNSTGTGTVNVSGDNSTLTVGEAPITESITPAISSGNLLVIGEAGNGTLTIEEGGLVTAHGGILLANQEDSIGTVNVVENGTLEVGGENGIAAGDGSYTFNLDGGRIRVIDSDLTTSLNIFVGELGCYDLPNIIDTNGFNATFSGVLSGGGFFQKEGDGNLTLAANETLTGGINVLRGSLIVDGALGGNIGSWCVSAGDLYVGMETPNTTAALYIINGARVFVDEAEFGNHCFDYDVILVSDTCSKLVVNEFLTVGQVGYANLTIANGGTVKVLGSAENGSSISIGRESNSSGLIVVTDEGSNLIADNGAVRVGDYGSGELLITNGATVSFNGTDSRNVTLFIGRHEESSGTVTVDNGMLSINNGGVRVGDYGTGTLVVTNGGEVDINGVENSLNVGLDIGRHGTGTVTVDGTGSAIYVANGATVVGNSGNGTLNIVNGSSLTSAGLGGGISVAVIGLNEGTNGTVNVTGAPIEPGIVTPSFQPSGWLINNGALVVGEWGNGTLNVSNGGKVNIADSASGTSLYVGINPDSTGTISIDGEGSALTVGSNGGAVYVGYNGNSTGSVSISNGGTFTITPNVNLYLGLSANSSGTLEVAGGTLNVTAGAISVGDSGTGTLNITNGGSASTNYMAIGTNSGANGTVLVDGEGSSLTANASDLGYHGNGNLTVSNGGSATFNSYLAVGTSDNGPGNGTLLVDNGTVTVGGIVIGPAGDGRVNVVNNGLLTTNTTITVGSGSSFGALTLSNGGELQVGNTGEFGNISGLTGAGNYSISMDGGIIQVINNDLTTSVDITLGSCFELPNIIDTNCFDATFSGILTGSGSLEKDGHGTLTLTNNSTYTGDTIVHKGTLVVDFTSFGGEEPGDLIVGDVCFSNGTFIAQNDTAFNTNSVVIGRDSHSHGYATVDASSLFAAGAITIGDSGHGSLSVVNDGYVQINGTSDDWGLILGASSCFATGNLTVDNSGLQVMNGSMVVGLSGSGCVTLTNGGTISVNGSLYVGFSENSTGSVTINNGGNFTVLGASDNGAALTIGRYEGSNGSVTVSDEETLLTVANGSVRVGDYGQGSLTVENGANITLNGTQDNGSTLVIGRHDSGNGTVTVTNATLNIDNGGVRVGDYGTGSLSILNGGVVNTNGTDNNGIGVAIGKHSSSNGTLSISGTESALFMYSGTLSVGYDGSGSVSITDGGFLGTGIGADNDVVATIGTNEGANGSVTISGVNTDTGNQSTMMVVQGALTVGLFGNGTVDVTNGGALLITDSDENGIGLHIGYGEGSNGSVVVDGVAVYGSEEEPIAVASNLAVGSGSLVVGGDGNGSLTITNGANASVGFGTGVFMPAPSALLVGENESGNGTVTVSNYATLAVADVVIIGNDGNGSLTVTNGGNVTVGGGIHPTIPDETAAMAIGHHEGSNGTVLVTDADSILNVGGDLAVGVHGTGSLTVANGGNVTVGTGMGPADVLSPTSFVGAEEGGNGTVTVTDDHSTLIVESFTSIGGNGTGSLTVANGGNASFSAMDVATGVNSTGTVLVTDANSTLTVNEFLGVGNYGNGTLTVANGATVNASSIGIANSGNGTIIVQDANSTLNTSGIGVGYNGLGNLTVANGGTVATNNLTIGLAEEGLGGSVTVTDVNSSILANGSIIVGENGLGNLTIANGGIFSNNGMDGDEIGLVVGNATNSTGYVTLTDGGSQYNAYEGAVLVGRNGNGTLTIENGGKMIVSGTDEDAFVMHLGDQEGSSGIATVTGFCSVLQLTEGGLVIGNGGFGNLSILCGGEVDIASGFSLMLAAGANSTGIVNLNYGGTLKIGGEDAIASGAGAATFNLNGGTIRAKSDFSTSVNFSLGSGTSSINTHGYNGTVSGSINGTGNLSKDGTGTLTLTGNSSYNGTNVNNGNLVVNGILTSNVTVTASSAALGGNGTITGNVLVNAGSVSPGVANAVTGNTASGFANFTVSNDLTLNVTATTLLWHLNSANATALSDVLNVLGNLTAGQATPTITFDFQNTGYFDATTPHTYSLITAGNDISAQGFNFVATNLNTDVPTWAANSSYFLYANGGSTLQFVVVPEPATWSLILGGMALLMGLRRRRKV